MLTFKSFPRDGDDETSHPSCDDEPDDPQHQLFGPSVRCIRGVP